MTVCPTCGADNPKHSRSCGQCGVQLGAERGSAETRHVVTVVTSDLKGSTSLGERLDPESLREVLTRYFDEMRAVLEAHGGTIEKIIGDAIIAVFGLPAQRDDDALRAVAAAADTLRVLADLNDALDATWGVRLVTRTGVATGDVVVGEASYGQHVLTGPALQLATAMEQNAPAMEVLVHESTHRLVAESVEVEQVEPFIPKGMDDPVTAYRLVTVHPGSGSATSPSHESGLASGIATARESRKTVTLVFADPRPMAVNGVQPTPEALRDVMSSYFEAMQAILERHGGTVEKFIGDAVMAVYGLPIRHEDDAIRAIRAAAEMQAALPALNEAFRKRWDIELRNHIGINTGEVITGDATTGQRLVTGDAVNTAARLEQAAGAAEIILGDLTYRLARDHIEVEVIPPLTLKGKAEPVSAYRLIRVRDGPAGTDTDAPPFVGREAETSRLSETLSDADDHKHARLLTIVGDAGVGKSRLIKEFATAVSRDARVVAGRCLPYGDGITFWPLAEIVRDAAGIASDDAVETATEKIHRLLVGTNLDGDARAEVADRIAAAIGLAQAQFSVAELFWGARKFLESLAQERPLVMIVDDIHSAVPTFLDLLDYLVETVEGVSILLLCSARRELVDRHTEWAERHAEILIFLEPLSDSDTGRMIGEILGQTGLDTAIVGRVVAAAEGNPLFVEQMVSMLVDNGTLQREGERWVATGAAGDIVVPPTIHALLAARLDDLGEDERAVVEPASIVGLFFAQAAVEDLIGAARRSSVPDHLKTLAHKQFVRPETLDDDDAYRFGHQLIRDTVYGSLLKRERVVFHERFVDWADEINRQRGRETEFEEILGYHLEQAHRYRRDLGPLGEHGSAVGIRASTRLASAGRRSLARGDFPAAANLLKRAASLLDDHHPEKPRLLLAAGEAFMEIGEFAASDASLVSAVGKAATQGDVAVQTTAELVRLQLQFRFEASTSVEAVLEQTRAGIDALETLDDPSGLARAWRLLEMVHGTGGRYGAAAEANQRAIEQARRAGDRVMELRLLASTAMGALYGPTPVQAGVVRCEDVLQLVEGDRRAQAVTISALAQLRAMNGDFRLAREDYRRGRAILEELGLRFDAATMSIYSGPAELMAGDPVAAEAELKKDYGALDAMGERNYISTIAGLLAEALYRQGRFGEAAGFVAFCQEVAAPSDVYSQYLWRGIRGKLLARDGAADEGIGLATSGVLESRESDDIDGQGNALVFLAEAQVAAGRHEDASRSAEAAARLFSAKGNVVSAERAGSLVTLAGVAVPATRSAHRLKR